MGLGKQPSAITLPAERQFMDVLGIHTAFYRAGPAAPGRDGKGTVILLHGGAPGVSAELNWFRNFPCLLDAGYEVIAYDQPGFGYSSIPQDHSIEFRYQHMVEFLRTLGPEEVHLCGNSIGGLLCSLYALRSPQGARAKSLTLAAPFSFFDPPTIVQERLQSHRARLGSIEQSFESINALCLNTFCQPESVTKDIVQLRLSNLQGERWDAYKARSKVSREFDKGSVANRKIETPSLVVWGVEDRSLPYEIGVEAMNHFVRGRFLFVTQSGHWPQTEQASTFNQAMLDFLSSV